MCVGGLLKKCTVACCVSGTQDEIQEMKRRFKMMVRSDWLQMAFVAWCVISQGLAWVTQCCAAMAAIP